MAFSPLNLPLRIDHAVTRLEPLVLDEEIDCVVAESEDGFCQLGMERRFLSSELGYPDTSLNRYVIEGYPDRLEPSIGQLCDWNRFENKDVTLLVMPSKRLESRLKGLIIAPYDGAECYKKFACAWWARPYRDFMYNVTYEALYQAHHRLGAKRIGLTHLSRVKTWPGDFKLDVTKCQVEAVLHFAKDYEGLESVTFWDDIPGNHVQESVDYFLSLPDIGSHRQIRRFSTQQWGIEFVTISWPSVATRDAGWVIVERLCPNPRKGDIRLVRVEDVEGLPESWQLASGVFTDEGEALELLAELRKKLEP